MISLVTLFQWSKTIHRLSLFGMVGLGLIMGTTGSWMKFSQLAMLTPRLDLQMVRYLHNQMSPFFSIFLGLMTVTGLYMYWFPWYSKRQALKKAQQVNTNVQPPSL
jgi:uncharacterized iron-regulated membrane protein